ncbi:MAG: hypothetical protein PHX44_01280 [Sulfurimonas sp.]|uniref:hypothetical protein n=1 Tax=Sulfurimonas sp. TaxID=2022749 RepID=UPI002624D0B5|nr:hypothetical protein [Sulfurimonas sp.]MDD2651665.1 hypothetical protein [Sulfurimonas sp.]MDD3451476.1 hypothetical protein [Sulfurimonas sp.]
MDNTLYAVANERNFINTVSPKEEQSEFFYNKREFDGVVLVPNDAFLSNIEAFFDGERLCQREYEMFERFVKYADEQGLDVFSKVLDEELGKIGV